MTPVAIGQPLFKAVGVVQVCLVGQQVAGGDVSVLALPRIQAVVVSRQSAQTAIVALSGRLDIDTGHQLHAALNHLREQLVTGIITGVITGVIVDLSGLTFCDSTGLSALVTTHHHCTAFGGYLRLAAPSPFLYGMLRVVGVAGVTPIYTCVPAAYTADPTGVVTDNTELTPPNEPDGTNRVSRR